jgi:ATP-binding cassette subfamily B protein
VADAADADLPGLLPSLWRTFRLAYRAEPRLLLVSLALVVTSWIPQSLNAFWLKLIADGLVRDGGVVLVVGLAGLAGSVALGWLLSTTGSRIALYFSVRVTVAVETHLARLQAGTVGLEHHERPEYLDRLQVLKDQTHRLENVYRDFFSVVGAAARLAITVGLLVSVHPVLAVLALFAVPAAATASWQAGAERRARERAAPSARLARHLFTLCTTPGPGKEIRVTRIASLLAGRRRQAWEAWYAVVARARWSRTAWQVGSWALFGAAYVGAIVLVVVGLQATPGSVLLVIAAGGNLSGYLWTALSQAEGLRWTADSARRLAWLEDYVSARRPAGALPAPDRIRRGIQFNGVWFRYPGTEPFVLQDVNLDLPAGSVVALVGENGAGKSTLVKLLCDFYEPLEGRIGVDGLDLTRIDADQWRARLAGAFQDFMQFEFRVRQAVGIGDLPREEAVEALWTALARGGATDIVERLPDRLDTQLGQTWADGIDLSFGQWQRLALARGFMRDRPLLTVLDEPTAALDAETEQELFERFAAKARAGASDGGLTILVSHRFSTVRMADLIVVIDGGRVVETGSHQELMARGGLYAELYGIQASAYR